MATTLPLCPIELGFEQNFSPDPFENTDTIRLSHRMAIRYGKPDDIKLLIQGTKEEGKDYLRGLLATSITIFCIAVVWCFLLIVFKCLGPRKVGWLSGTQIPLPPQPRQEDYGKDGDEDEDDGNPSQSSFLQDTAVWQQKYNRILRRRRFMKAAIVFSGLVIVANAIMLSVKG